MLQAILRVVGGKNDGQLITLPAGRFLIGREQDCHLRPNNEVVSRHHCVFTCDGYQVRLRDLGSTNGTLVNGERLRGQTELNAGDRIAVGKLEFEVELVEGTPPEAAPAIDISNLGGSDPETSEMAGEDTEYELPSFDAGAAEDGAASADTATIPVQPVPQPQQPYPPQPAGPYGGYVQPGYYPQYPQPMQYPPMGYPAAPMPYPAPGMYPQYPGQPPMQQPQGPAQTTMDPNAVQLPDPSTTGAAPPQPQAEQSSGGQPANPSEKAAELIRQQMQRRPTSED